MLTSTPNKNNICVIIVTYHPDCDITTRIEHIKNQIEIIIIVDNGSTPSEIDILQKLTDDKVTLITNQENFGIAYALNQGIKVAQQKKVDWILLFDQDSQPFSHIVDEFKQIYEDFEPKDQLSIIGSNYINPKTNKPYYELNSFDRCWQKEDVVITSGSFINIRIFDKLGFFREDYFIDAVDFEFCLRVSRCNYQIIVTKKPLMLHSVGNTTYHKIFWLRYGTSNHPPVRRYYMMRNSIILFFEYFLYKPIWVTRRLLSQIKGLILILCFENQKLAKLQAVFLGLKDGIVRNMGKRKANFWGEKS